jgi:hypothetical protein
MSEVAAIVDDLEAGLGSALGLLRGMRDGRVSSAEIPGLCVELGILLGELRRGKALLLHAEGPVRRRVLCGKDLAAGEGVDALRDIESLSPLEVSHE